MATGRMTKLPSEQEEAIEESLGEIAEAYEHGARSRAEIEPLLNERVKPGILAELMNRRLVEINGADVALTSSGKAVADRLLRRKRLSERLLKDVLGLKDDLIEPAVCQWEHILSQEVANSICTLLGHPRQSPTHQPIPPGDCCRSATTQVAPVVSTLSKIGPGERAKVAYLMIKEYPELDRLLSMGLVPGTEIEVIQRFPTYVLQVNESQLAFDEGIAEGVFVQPLKNH
jgi:DtxR family Mn-dependent transcriptional regulator